MSQAYNITLLLQLVRPTSSLESHVYLRICNYACIYSVTCVVQTLRMYIFKDRVDCVE